MNYFEETSNNYMTIKQLDKYLVGHNGYIAGGIFKNIFNKEKYKDIDIFFRTKEDYIKALPYFKGRYKEYYSNEKVVAFKDKDSGIVLELINHVFLEPEDMLNTFDFTITKVAYYNFIQDAPTKNPKPLPSEGILLIHDKFFEHLLLKRLVIDNEIADINYPVSTYNRMFRYGKYGYQPCRGTKIKVIQALRSIESFSELDLDQGLYSGVD